MGSHLTAQPDLLDDRPAAADFALCGPLTGLTQANRTPAATRAEIAPRICARVTRAENPRDFESDSAGWLPDAETLPDRLVALPAAASRTHRPPRIGKARAVIAGQADLRTPVDGQTWVPPPLPDPLEGLRRTCAALHARDPEARAVARPVPDRAGLLPLIDAAIDL